MLTKKVWYYIPNEDRHWGLFRFTLLITIASSVWFPWVIFFSGQGAEFHITMGVIVVLQLIGVLSIIRGEK